MTRKKMSENKINEDPDYKWWEIEKNKKCQIEKWLKFWIFSRKLSMKFSMCFQF